MILPTKRISADRSLLALGAEILVIIGSDRKTVSELWSDFQRKRSMIRPIRLITYDWFVLALDLLFAIQAIEWSDGFLSRVARAPEERQIR